MNPDVKKRWIEALRSGDYKQGRGWLRNIDDEYCCLGVLENLIQPEGWSAQAGGWSASNNSVMFISDATRHQASISHEATNCLMNMNDMEGKTFSQIADYIEENL